MRWGLRRSTFEAELFVILQEELIGLEGGREGMEEGGDEEDEEEGSREGDGDVPIHRSGKNVKVGIPRNYIERLDSGASS